MFRSILVALDGSPQSVAALCMAYDIAQRYHAKLGLVYAFPHVADMLGTAQYDALVESRMQHGEQIMAEAMAQIGRAVPIETHLLEGPAASAILSVAKIEGYDLIAVGSRGQGQIRGLLLGSVSSAVAQEASCPVLVAHGLRQEANDPQPVPFAAGTSG